MKIIGFFLRALLLCGSLVSLVLMVIYSAQHYNMLVRHPEQPNKSWSERKVKADAKIPTPECRCHTALLSWMMHADVHKPEQTHPHTGRIRSCLKTKSAAHNCGNKVPFRYEGRARRAELQPA